MDWRLEPAGLAALNVSIVTTATEPEMERVEIIAAGRIEASSKGKSQAVWTKL